jgi:hypothetical protein
MMDGWMEGLAGLTTWRRNAEGLSPYFVSCYSKSFLLNLHFTYSRSRKPLLSPIR